MTQYDRETIEAFEWVADDTPLPVDPDDPESLERAITWAECEYKKYEYECFIAQYRDDGEIDLLRGDRRAIGLFIAALKRTLHAMRQRDRALLAAWEAGEPIREVQS